MKTIFWAATVSILHTKKCISESTLSNQFLKLFKESGIGFNNGTFQRDQNAPDVWQSNSPKTENKVKQLLIEGAVAPI